MLSWTNWGENVIHDLTKKSSNWQVTHHGSECQVKVEPHGRAPVEFRGDDVGLEDEGGGDHGDDEDEGADVADLLREDALAPEPRRHRVE